MTDYAKWDKFVADLSSDSDDGGVGIVSENRGVASRDASSRGYAARGKDEGEPVQDREHGAEGIASVVDAYKTIEGVSGVESVLELSLGAQKLVEELGVNEKGLDRVRALREECDSVREALSVFPTKTRHQVMVPLGNGRGSKLAFREGELVHPNEVFVKLDETYVERTAAQAAAILERRGAHYSKQERDLEEKAVALRRSIAFASEAANLRGNFIDIYEDEDEMRRYEEELALRRKQGGGRKQKGQEPVTDEEFDTMLQKLESLEKLEDAGSDKSLPEVKSVGEAGTSGGSQAVQERAAEKTNRHQAFTGSVVEKRVGGASRGKPGGSGQGGGEQEQRRTRPVSRFKMSLQNRQQ
ncbi:hypothetical protein HOP50_12g67280 [Chloropicon primus]|uniref:Uncharacterized protein n=2 Tax=Chloropicon primus TaxID=1764295 RepID=A0A5B8MV47_9CHLO|nr:hypothetical protein A3770_12p67090 [Chloropicon primus]UPR03399.1 hypothetical protein HOP50_12g67280 [Chloropicon primus]|eukprot:QDZ24191.1 hypothetical protein A3770_12p67090 [Chloropicon primus]